MASFSCVTARRAGGNRNQNSSRTLNAKISALAGFQFSFRCSAIYNWRRTNMTSSLCDHRFVESPKATRIFHFVIHSSFSCTSLELHAVNSFAVNFFPWATIPMLIYRLRSIAGVDGIPISLRSIGILNGNLSYAWRNFQIPRLVTKVLELSEKHFPHRGEMFFNFQRESSDYFGCECLMVKFTLTYANYGIMRLQTSLFSKPFSSGFSTGFSCGNLSITPSSRASPGPALFNFGVELRRELKCHCSKNKSLFYIRKIWQQRCLLFQGNSSAFYITKEFSWRENFPSRVFYYPANAITAAR